MNRIACSYYTGGHYDVILVYIGIETHHCDYHFLELYSCFVVIVVVAIIDCVGFCHKYYLEEEFEYRLEVLNDIGNLGSRIRFGLILVT